MEISARGSRVLLRLRGRKSPLLKGELRKRSEIRLSARPGTRSGVPRWRKQRMPRGKGELRHRAERRLEEDRDEQVKGIWVMVGLLGWMVWVILYQFQFYR